jgi:hypothetical protein
MASTIRTLKIWLTESSSATTIILRPTFLEINLSGRKTLSILRILMKGTSKPESDMSAIEDITMKKSS